MRFSLSSHSIWSHSNSVGSAFGRPCTAAVSRQSGPEMGGKVDGWVGRGVRACGRGGRGGHLARPLGRAGDISRPRPAGDEKIHRVEAADAQRLCRQVHDLVVSRPLHSTAVLNAFVLRVCGGALCRRPGVRGMCTRAKGELGREGPGGS